MTKKFQTQFAKTKGNNGSFKGMFELEFDDKKGDKIPDTIHLIPIGAWEHDLYGPIIINASDIREYIQNFNAGIRKGVFITAGHEGFQELPAVGWIVELEQRDTGLWGKVEWNEEGKKLLSDKAFKYFSPELCRDYEDPQTHQFYRNVMTGGALTKSPYFKELEQIVFSEKAIKNFSNNNNKDTTMDLKTLLDKDMTTLSDEEKAFIKANADQLTEEQKASHASIIEEPETPEEKEAREKKEADEKAAADQKAIEEENIAKGLNADGSAKEDAPPADETIQASEKKQVMISASELTALRAKADEGAAAFAELKKTKLDAEVKSLIFSENNKTGTFLPKGEATLRSFMETLNPTQTASFKEVLKNLPKSGIFTENGETGAIDSTGQAELETKVNAKLAANPKMTYSEALKAVLSENKGLEERYDSSLPLAKKGNA